MNRLLRKYRLSPTLPALAVAALAFALVAPDRASAAYTYKTLHSFCSGTNCSDGASPQDRVVMDQYGNLYGTTLLEGTYRGGVVFKLVPNSDKSRYKDYLLHNFCRRQGCPDGYNSSAGVILDVDGNLYGTAQSGGANNGGVIFKLTHGTKGWAFRVLKSFCEETNCADGDFPEVGLSYAGQDSGKAWDGSSPLFGTTDDGGAYNKGVTYELTSNGAYSVIHNFQTAEFPNEVLVDSGGNIYGTASTGGKYGFGEMYKLASGTWNETVLHNFCNTTNCADGGNPRGRLFMDASGNLFGATDNGGSNRNDSVCGGTCGVLFERASGGTYSVLYNFCSQANCTDGANAGAGVIIDGSGSLFGTTIGGGANGGGTMYEFSRGTESVLYSFCSQQDCADGATPVGSLILDSSGAFFGMTSGGGSNICSGGCGTVFRLGP